MPQHRATSDSGRRRRGIGLAVAVVAVVAVGALIMQNVVSERIQAAQEQAELEAEEQQRVEEEAAARAAEEAERARKAQAVADLEAVVQQQLATFEGTYAVTVTELTGDERTASVDGDLAKEPASTIKLFIAWATLQLVDAGEVSLSRTLGNGQTVSACLTQMIEQSDNDCSVYLRLLVGNDRINSMWAEAGYANTAILLDSDGGYDGKQTSTNDQSLLQRLVAGTALSEESTTLLLDHLKVQVWRTRVPAGVPEGVVVADKPGWLEIDSGWTQSDAAIVWGESSTYIITVLGSEGALESEIAQLSSAVYAELNG